MLNIIIVSWNVRELLRACLRSLQAHACGVAEQRVIVVDNASADGTIDMVRAEFPAVDVIANTTNRGFTGGNNDGLRVALDRAGGDDDFVLLLNPDTEAGPGALDVLVRQARSDAGIGVVGPQLRYPNGAVQSSRRRLPTLATAMFESTWLQSVAPRRLLDAYYVRDRRDDEACDVDWVVGAALLARASAALAVGGFDEGFFMYSEELDWCKRFRDRGWRVVYQPAAVVVHHEGKSSEQVSAKRMLYFNASKVRYFAKHHGRLAADLLRLSLLAQFAWQTGLEGVKWLAGSRRELRAERVRAYVGVLRSGLEHI